MKRLFFITATLCCLLVGGKVSAQTFWTCNVNNYQYGMTAYLTLSSLGIEISDLPDFEVAAFYQDECRGVSSLESVDENTSYLYLRLRSNMTAGEEMTFKAYSKKYDTVYTLDYTLTFEDLKVVGLPSQPIVLELGKLIPTDKPSLGDANGDGYVNIIDVNLLIGKILGTVADDIIEENIDINKDGDLNVADLNLMIGIILSDDNQSL